MMIESYKIIFVELFKPWNAFAANIGHCMNKLHGVVFSATSAVFIIWYQDLDYLSVGCPYPVEDGDIFAKYKF